MNEETNPSGFATEAETRSASSEEIEAMSAPAPSVGPMPDPPASVVIDTATPGSLGKVTPAPAPDSTVAVEGLLAGSIASVVGYYTSHATAGLTMGGAWGLAHSALATMIQLAEAVGGLSADAKKGIILDGARQLFVAIMPLVNSRLPFFPFASTIETTMIEPIYLTLIGHSYDSLLAVMQRAGFADVRQPNLDAQIPLGRTLASASDPVELLRRRMAAVRPY